MCDFEEKKPKRPKNFRARKTQKNAPKDSAKTPKKFRVPTAAARQKKKKTGRRTNLRPRLKKQFHILPVITVQSGNRTVSERDAVSVAKKKRRLPPKISVRIVRFEITRSEFIRLEIIRLEIVRFEPAD